MIAGDVCTIVAVSRLRPSCMAVHGRRACGRGVVAAVGVRPLDAITAVLVVALGVAPVVAVVPWFLCRRHVVTTRR